METLKSLLGEVLGNYVTLIISIAGGALLAYLRKRGSSWFQPILFGFIGFLLIAAGLLILAGFSRLPALGNGAQRTTPQNIEAKVFEWLKNFKFASKPVNSGPDFNFLLEATGPNSVKILVGQHKGLDRYLLLQSGIQFNEPERAKIQKMSDSERSQFYGEISLELARVGSTFQIDLADGKVYIIKRVAIGDSLTEGAFIEALSDTALAKIVLIETIARRFGRFGFRDHV